MSHVEHTGAEGLVVDELERMGRCVLEQPLAVADGDRMDEQVRLVEEPVRQRPTYERGDAKTRRWACPAAVPGATAR